MLFIPHIYLQSVF